MNEEVAAAPNFVDPTPERCRDWRSLKLGDAVDEPNSAGIFLHQDIGVMLCHMFSEHSLESGEKTDEVSRLEVVDGSLQISRCSLCDWEGEVLPPPLLLHILEGSIYGVVLVTHTLEEGDILVAHSDPSSPLSVNPVPP